MTRNALVLGCGNIAPSHARALKKLKCNVHVFDTDERKARHFCELYSVNLHRDGKTRYHIVSLCVPYNFRDTYFDLFFPAMKSSDILVIEKPLRNIHGECQGFVSEHIEKIWTPYLRIFGLPAIGRFNHLRIKETRGYLHASNTFKETVFDLFPHWLSVLVHYNLEPADYVFVPARDGLHMKLTDKHNANKTAEIIFHQGDNHFQVLADNKPLAIPKNRFTALEFLKFTRYYLSREWGGAFFQFYRAVLNNSQELRKLCNEMFTLTGWIKVDAL